MFDFSFRSCSFEMYLYCICIWMLVVIPFWKKNTNRNVFKRKIDQPIIWFLVLIDFLTCFYQGDFWHYQAFVVYREERWIPGEEMYGYLAEFLNHNYFLFRFVVWGSALVLLRLLFSRYKLENGNALYCLFALFITIFDYARASLALIVYFFGLSFLCMPAQLCGFHRIARYLFGTFILVSSFFFHHSMAIIIAGSVILLLPLNKKTIISIGVLLPITIIVIYKLLAYDLGFDYLFDEMITKKMEGNLRLEVEAKSFFETFRYLWLYSIFYISFIFILYIILIKSNLKRVPREIKSLVKISMLIISIATGLLFLGLDNQVLFYRVLYLSIVPITLLLCLLKKYNYLSITAYRRFLLFGIMYTAFSFIKGIISWNGNLM